MQPPTIALVMIVRNGAATLARCLSSVREHVDEIIVLDTGSTDESVAIARRFGARVHHFEWVDDFSAARNAALSHSACDWNLILDDDNWLESGHELLRQLGRDPFMGQIAIANRFMQNGAVRESTEWVTRVLPRGTRYAGRIHEQAVNAAGLPRRRLAIRAGHDGYMPQGLEAKKGRNEALLRTALEESPQDPYLHYQLGKELAIYERHAEAADHFMRAIHGSSEGDPFRHDLITRALFTLKQAGLLEQAVNAAGLPRRRLAIRAGHDGYMPQGLEAKKGRNEALLRTALEESPQDPYLHYQLGKELAIYERHAEAADHFMRAIHGSSEGDPFRHDLITRALFTLKQAGLLEQAILLAENEFAHWQDSPDFFFCVADVFLDWAIRHPAQAEAQFLPIVESSWLKCLEIGERPDLSESVAGRGSYLAAQNLAVLYENTGRPALAAEYREKARVMRQG